MSRIALFILSIVVIATPPATAQVQNRTAVFAGGCFWCMEAEYKSLKGIDSVISGYTGGTTANPTYKTISQGDTGHVEAIKVSYDPNQITYQRLLEIFWSNVDPTDDEGQFCDKGSQYRAGIFTQDDEQKTLAETSKAEAQKRFNTPIATFIRPAATFYPAEDYHQDYYIKNKTRYKLYKQACGRDERLKELKATK